MITLTSVEAQNRFGQLLDMAQREPVSITRRGRPAAFVISPQEMQELHEARRARGVESGRQHLARAQACAEAWNALHAEHGSFADDHSTL